MENEYAVNLNNEEGWSEFYPHIDGTESVFACIQCSSYINQNKFKSIF